MTTKQIVDECNRTAHCNECKIQLYCNRYMGLFHDTPADNDDEEIRNLFHTKGHSYSTTYEIVI